MNKVLSVRFVPAVFFLFLSLVLSAETATLRERSSAYFGTVDWTGPDKKLPASAIPGMNVPGGNETFPVLAGLPGKTVSPASAYAPAISALYPREERLGTLDYSLTDPRLLSLLLSVADSFGKLKLDPVLCDPAQPFIPVLAEFRLVRLPPVQGVLFSKPQATAAGGQSAIFRLLCKQPDVSAPVYLTVTARPVSAEWKITEVLFDGESYAGIAQPY